jgi:H+-transporting ATPase
LEKGLSLEEVRKRIGEYGYNEVPEQRVNPFIKFAKKFWGITPWMLEITIIMEWILGKYLEAYIIIGLLFFNAVVSFIQEEKANDALALLKQELRISARVKRNSQWILIPARDLVPGDIIRLRAGDFVPADIKVLEGILDVDQSALTGESLTVERKINDTLFSGSIIRTGEITGVVTSTGTKTYFGQTVELVQIAKPKLHMEEVISKVVRWLLLMVGVTLSIGIALSIVKGISLAEIVPLAVILLVSAIPVALPTMFTISMALGSLELFKKGALVTRLDATEDAATMDVLCVDKTGTITMNKLSIADVIAIGEYKKEDVILYGALASQEANQDPIDLAFISASKEMQIPLNSYMQRRFIPFNPSTRRTEATIEKEGQQFLATKGAVKTVCDLCRSSQEELERASKDVENLSSKGYRVIAVAKGTTEKGNRLVGVAALHDKPRPDSARLIGELEDLGISVKMLTGDALPIAKEIAKQVGLGENINRISDLKDSLKEDRTLQIIEESNGFAEIYPEDKYLIVKSLQERKHIVGMTGDGINDAPALRQAEVGIAVSNATDVAKKAASAVLTIEGFEGMLDLVRIGRMVYQRIASWTINKIIRTFKRVVFIVLAFILTGKYVVSTFNMILLLFLSDYVTLSISTDNVRYSKKPESWNTTGLVKLGVLYGIIIVIESMLLLYIGFSYFGLYNNIDQLHTFVFVWLTLSGYFTVLSIRERRHFWTSKPSNPLILSLAINSVIVFLMSIFGIPGLTSITLTEFATILTYSFFTCLIINDSTKTSLAERFEVAI